MEGQPIKPRVLIVDDAPENIQLLRKMLHADWLPLCASNGVEALQLANEDPAPDVILLGIMMPGMNGYEVCTRLKSEQKTRDIPIIFVTSLSDKSEEHKGLELGGADYISRPFSSKLVKARIRYQLEIKRHRALPGGADAKPRAQSEGAAPDLVSELSERKHLQDELSHLNRELESLLADSRSQLAAARQEQHLTAQSLARDRNEIALLKENLQRQTNEYHTVSRELEALSFSISHDLRAPLRHLLGFSGALQEDCADQLDDAAQGFLCCISKAARKMEAQIEALLGLSRVARQHLSIVSVDLSRMVRESAAALQASAPGRRGVFSVADHLLVQADASLLQAAIDHLLGNAWKFTKGKDAAAIEFGRQPGGVFYLRDNGAGFDMRYADRLFGAFQRMHKESEFEGTGIGLATVQRIIHRHGGRIWAEATLDGGTTFFFTLSD